MSQQAFYEQCQKAEEYEHYLLEQQYQEWLADAQAQAEYQQFLIEQEKRYLGEISWDLPQQSQKAITKRRQQGCTSHDATA
jgi:hypothetical protein